MASSDEPQPGQTWAYRTAVSSARFHEAAVLTVGEKRPVRVRIELVANEWQGERRWVSPSRLEVRWEDRHAYIELDQKRRAVAAFDPSVEQWRTAELVLWKSVPFELAEFNRDSAGSITVHDVPALAQYLRVDRQDLESPPAYYDGPDLHAAWPTTELIGRTAAALHPADIIDYIEEQERTAQEHALHGDNFTSIVDGQEYYIAPDDARRRFIERTLPELDRLRDWIGVERSAEIEGQRMLLDRLGRVTAVAERALEDLEPRHKTLVLKLRKELEAALDGVIVLPPGGDREV
ncbi:hypothetical protein [Curtobacterium sp. Leaf154]|uniref:hypothetical protein n=1 Tax=Curtobacterium sp. Leaf154 TaxID=1736277 RepID=UPI0006F6EB60|nr:hypothetical protein [Curtobacterium sp. Leaf154]KQR34781.1 hypothetical protein ASF75_03180 [Curtobacterium sp. Leaf154]